MLTDTISMWEIICNELKFLVFSLKLIILELLLCSVIVLLNTNPRGNKKANSQTQRKERD